jgi:hypothetical protein
MPDADSVKVEAQAAIDQAIAPLQAALTEAETTIADRDAQILDLQAALDACRVALTARFPGDPGIGLMWWGASVEGGIGPQLAAFEAATGKPTQPFRTYMTKDETASQILNKISQHIGAGRFAWASLKFPMSWAQVAAGGGDTRLVTIADGLAQLPVHTWITLHHEPNKDPGTPAEYRAMWEHIVPLMRQHDGGNVAYMLVIGGENFESDPTLAASYIPDPSVFDGFGFDLYNAFSMTNGKQWRQFGERADFILPFVPESKPVVVAEFGCREDTRDPDRATTWLTNMYEYCQAHGFAAVSYFNSGANSPDGTWALDGARLNRYIQLLNDPRTARLP